MRRFWLCMVLSCSVLAARETLPLSGGRLIQYSNREIVVRLDGTVPVAEGRQLELYENVPGLGDVAVRGYWTVSSVTGTEARARPSANAGTPQLGCRARFLEPGQIAARRSQTVDVTGLLGKKDAFTAPRTGPPVEELRRMGERGTVPTTSMTSLLDDLVYDLELGRELAAQVRVDTRFRNASDRQVAREVARRRAVIIVQTVRLLSAGAGK